MNNSHINRVVILGSNSFIAKSLIKNLKKEKIKIKNISRNEVNFNNTSDCLKLKKILKENDIIFFVAAKAPAKNYNMMMYNLKICKNIVNIVKYVNYSHFIYVSSDAVYKDSKKTLNENSIIEPDSYHGLMHFCREKIIMNELKKNISIVRPTLVFGLNDPHNGYGPNLFLRQAQKLKLISLFGKGEEKRDHIFIDDVGDLIFKIIKYKIYGIINLTSGNTISFYEIAQIIKEKLNIEITYKKRNGPMPHNGYRAFNNKLKDKRIKNFKYTSIKSWLEKLKL